MLGKRLIFPQKARNYIPFSKTSRPPVGPTEPPFSEDRALSWVWSARGLMLITVLDLMQKLGMSGALPLFHLYAFMASTLKALPSNCWSFCTCFRYNNNNNNNNNNEHPLWQIYKIYSLTQHSVKQLLLKIFHIIFHSYMFRLLSMEPSSGWALKKVLCTTDNILFCTISRITFSKILWNKLSCKAATNRYSLTL